MTRRLNLHAPLGAVLAAVLLLAAPAAAESAKVSADPDLRGTAEALLVWTLVGIDQARKTGKVDVLHGLGTPDYRRRVSAGQLRAMLGRFKADDFATFHASLKHLPRRLRYFRLQAEGETGLEVDACYCPEGYHLYFQIRFRKLSNQWRIDAMKVWDVVD